MLEYLSFLNWSQDFIQLPTSLYITQIHLLFFMLGAEIEALGQSFENPDVDDPELMIPLSIKNKYAINKIWVSDLFIVFQSYNHLFFLVQEMCLSRS